MKSKWVACCQSAALSFLMSVAACMCIPSAFSIPVDMSALLWVCALAAVTGAVCFTLPLAALPPVLLTLFTGLTYRNLLSGIEALCFRLSRFYDMAYGCGWFYWSQTPPYDTDVTPALCAMGCLISLTVSWVICRQKRAWSAVALSCLPLCACLVVTDTVPETSWMFLWMLGVGLLMLGQSVRRRNISQGNRLTVLVALPLALAIAVLFWAIPKENYRGQQRADQWLQWAQGLTESALSAPVTERVALDRTGQLLQLHTPMLELVTDLDTTLYLYQQGYQCYDGKSWYNRTCTDRFQWMVRDGFETAGHVQISTRELHVMQFVPHSAAPENIPSFHTQQGLYENKQLRYRYEYELLRLKDETVSAAVQPSADGPQLPVGQLPAETRVLPEATIAWARPLAQSLVAGKITVRQQAEAIADFVRGTASYSRATGRMANEQTDFARWFLEESDTGYCVHFATATTVLLRAAGIQAQYVTGYMVQARAGEKTVVYQDDAHAWTEYYDPAVGWRVLESTPAEGLPVHDRETLSTHPTMPDASSETVPEKPSVTPTEPVQPQPESGLWQVLYWLCLIPIAVLLVIGQWQLRLRLWEQRLQKAAPNKRALLYWQRIEKICKFLGTRPEAQLRELAVKAKFSQHTLTAEQLQQLENAIRDCEQRLKQRSWYLQPVYTLVLSIY